MTLTEMSTEILARLLQEAGTSDYWDATGIQRHINWLYKELAETLKNLTTRDTTTTSVTNTARYAIPKPTGVLSVLKMLEVTLDGEPLSFFTIADLYDVDYKWRNLDASPPWGWYYERGDNLSYVSFVPKFSDSTTVIGFEYCYKPSDLTASDTAKEPYADGQILMDGAMSLCFSDSGGGRDMDLADFYYEKLISHFSVLNEHQGNAVRGFRSKDESNKLNGRVRLPSNYPTYFFEE